MKTIALLTIGILLSGVPEITLAEVPDSIIRVVKDQPFQGRIANVLYVIEQNEIWSVTGIYSQPFAGVLQFDHDSPKRWIARRQYGQGDLLSDRVEWADSADCPALEGVLWSMSRIPVPSIQVRGLSRPRPSQGTPPLLMATHAPILTIWNTADMLSGAPSWLKLSSMGGEMQAWGELAETSLSGCWREAAPTS